MTQQVPCLAPFHTLCSCYQTSFLGPRFPVVDSLWFLLSISLELQQHRNSLGQRLCRVTLNRDSWTSVPSESVFLFICFLTFLLVQWWLLVCSLPIDHWVLQGFVLFVRPPLIAGSWPGASVICQHPGPRLLHPSTPQPPALETPQQSFLCFY